MRAKTEKHAGKHPRHRGTSGYANEPANQDRAHGLPQDKVHDFAAVSAERHADADLVHASAHTVRHHSIYADRSEQKREGAKCPRERGHNARGLTPNFEVVLEFGHVDGQVGVERLHYIANAFRGRGEVSCIANQHINAKIVLRPSRKIEIRRVDIAEVRDLCVPRHSDNRIFPPTAFAQCFCQCIFVGPKSPRCGFCNDYSGRVMCLSWQKSAARTMGTPTTEKYSGETWLYSIPILSTRPGTVNASALKSWLSGAHSACATSITPGSSEMRCRKRPINAVPRVSS